MDKLKSVFQGLLNSLDYTLEAMAPLVAHASPRALYRLTTDRGPVVGVHFDRIEENKAFIGFGKHFLSKDLPVPQVLAVHEDWSCYIMEDLGELSLYDFLLSERSDTDPFPASVKNFYHKALEDLVRFQVIGHEGLDYSLCYHGQIFDEQAMLKDCIYFQQELLGRKGIEYNQPSFQSDCKHFVKTLAEESTDYFYYRDFQARNIMIKDQRLYFIDYQSGRRGPAQADLASILFQSQAAIPTGAREELLESYLDTLLGFRKLDRERFKSFYYGFVVLRLIQVLGAYGRLGLGQGKEYFLNGIPVAVDNLSSVLSNYELPVGVDSFLEVLGLLKEA